MADHSTIQTTTGYAALLALLHGRLVDLAKGLDGVGTNLPTGAIRFDSAAKKWRKWSGSAWVDPVDVYNIKNSAANTTCNAVMGQTNVQGALEALAGVIPAGTRMLFQQSTAPTGWTKITDHNNKALRVVSGSASSGGSMDFTAAFASGRAASSVTVTGTVLGSSLSADQLASHQHESPYAATDTRYVQTSNGYVVFPGDSRALGSSSSGYSDRKRYRTDSRGGGNPHDHPFSANAHSHTMDMNVKYVDVIIASKN